MKDPLIIKFHQIRILRGLLTALLLLTTHPLYADLDDEDNQLGVSAVPIVSYDDKRGWMGGAAGFVYTDHEPGINAGFFGISNGNDSHNLGINYDQRSLGPWSTTTTLLAMRDFDNYYGEGDLTNAVEHSYARSTHFEARPSFLYRFLPHFRVGPYADFRSRREEEKVQVLPDEMSSSVGLHIEWDTRDKLINTRKGDYFQLNVGANTGVEHFTQFDLDLRRFTRLGRRLIIGDRFIAGTTEGRASYLFRYRLGGLHVLRGYKDNRFRGSEYFVVQEELRWWLKKWLSVNASIDAGDIRDEAYHQLKATGQIGIRLGLPPGFGQKMRADFGIGLDQTTFQIQFGEIF